MRIRLGIFDGEFNFNISDFEYLQNPYMSEDLVSIGHSIIALLPEERRPAVDTIISRHVSWSPIHESPMGERLSTPPIRYSAEFLIVPVMVPGNPAAASDSRQVLLSIIDLAFDEEESNPIAPAHIHLISMD